ncbi:hypothetical protein LIER_04598 [Lithospermum erythrorhizon]|uniref:Uncharacterized protein n=1 Tax=Lithospermum erythrorhizon TaxID=34254 RepID=A0AAV3NXI0_LITER
MMLRDPSNLEDIGVDVHGSEVLLCGEQSGDTKVEIVAINLEEINVTFHVDSAPASPKGPKRFDNTTCSEDVAPADSFALEDDMAATYR